MRKRLTKKELVKRNVDIKVFDSISYKQTYEKNPEHSKISFRIIIKTKNPPLEEWIQEIKNYVDKFPKKSFSSRKLFSFDEVMYKENNTKYTIDVIIDISYNSSYNNIIDNIKRNVKQYIIEEVESPINPY